MVKNSRKSVKIFVTIAINQLLDLEIDYHRLHMHLISSYGSTLSINISLIENQVKNKYKNM